MAMRIGCSVGTGLCCLHGLRERECYEKKAPRATLLFYAARGAAALLHIDGKSAGTLSRRILTPPAVVYSMIAARGGASRRAICALIICTMSSTWVSSMSILNSVMRGVVRLIADFLS
jgi:hypothetical protein